MSNRNTGYGVNVLEGKDGQPTRIEVHGSFINSCETLPSASAAEENHLYLVTKTTGTIVKGRIYKCVKDGSTYKWEDASQVLQTQLEGYGIHIDVNGEGNLVIGVDKSFIRTVAELPAVLDDTIKGNTYFLTETSGDYIKGHVYTCIKDGTEYKWKDISRDVVNYLTGYGVRFIETDDGTEVSVDREFIKKVVTLPIARESNANKTYLLTTSYDDYIKGHIYTCVEEDSSYVWKDITLEIVSYLSGNGIHFETTEDGIVISVVDAYIRTTDHLPEPTEELLDKNYFLTQDKDSYKMGHVYHCTKKGDDEYEWTDISYPAPYVPGPEDYIPNAENIRVEPDGEYCRIMWDDPADAPKTRWAKTVLVKNNYHAPKSIDDGVVVVSSTVRNTYSVDPFYDRMLEFKPHCFYKLFLVGENGLVTNNDANMREIG